MIQMCGCSVEKRIDHCSICLLEDVRSRASGVLLVVGFIPVRRQTFDRAASLSSWTVVRRVWMTKKVDEIDDHGQQGETGAGEAQAIDDLVTMEHDHCLEIEARCSLVESSS